MLNVGVRKLTLTYVLLQYLCRRLKVINNTSGNLAFPVKIQVETNNY